MVHHNGLPSTGDSDRDQPQGTLIIPHIIESTARGERAYDIFSRLLLDGIILLGAPIDDDVASVIIGQLLFLEQAKPKQGIQMYINCPGGVVTAGFAIYDTMKKVSETIDVSTICLGQAASMAAFLLTAGGMPGRRFALRNSQIMIHQPRGGYQGVVTDIEIHAEVIKQMKKRLTSIIAESCARARNEKYTRSFYERVLADMERDRFMSAKEALEYGLIDQVYDPGSKVGESRMNEIGLYSGEIPAE